MSSNGKQPPEWKILFWKWLYRAYKSNKGANAFLRHHVTPLGYILSFSLVLSMVLRLGSSNNVLFALIATQAAMLICSFIFVWCRRARIKVKRVLPQMGSVDSKMHYQVEVTNRSMFPIRAVHFRELAQHEIPSMDVFVHSVEPGEEKRNAFDRLFVVYRWAWLTRARSDFYSADSANFKLSGMEAKTVPMTIVPKRRGMLKMHDLRLMMPDPLCLFQRCKVLKQKHDGVLILPKRYKINHLDLPGSAKNQVGGEAQSRQVGQSSEFVSLRDYRCGDPIKHVDWKAWAKTGVPVVREYEDVFYPRHGLLLDTGVHPTLHEAFEEAVSVAASFGSSIDTNEGILDLVLMQQDAKVVTVGKGVERLDKMMEVLACADIEPSPQWEDLTKRILEVAPDFSSCIMVFADWSEERSRLVAKTAALGVGVVCLLVSNDLEKSKSQLIDAGSAVKVHLLEVGNIQKGLNIALA